MQRSSANISTLITLLLVIATLRFGEAVLMPLALAVLIAFALSPVVDRLERWHFGRAPSVIGATLLVCSLLIGLGWMIGRELGTLGEHLPQYRKNLSDKATQLQGPLGSFSAASEEITKLSEDLEREGGRTAPKVEVVAKPSTIETVRGLLTPIVGPLGTAALVTILALFLLLERDELRDRMIWLTGAQDLSLTTHALDDATSRVSRYLAMQSLVCGLHGVAVGLGLFAIGIPGAVLWGGLSAALRFLPYFGPWIAAALPITLSLAAFPGWNEPLMTVGLFIALELVSNNVLEPWLYGTSVGLSPFGVVFSAVFWTWLWGIPGLIVAMPLTVSLVVAGRYVRGLRYFPVLFGDQPALPPDVRLYQRLLALDVDEASAVLRSCALVGSLDELSDTVVLPVLRRLAEDDQRDAFDDAKTEVVREHLRKMLDEIAAATEAPAIGDARARVLFVAALDESDALASRWLAQISEARGIESTVASFHGLASEIVEQARVEKFDAICISALTLRAASQARNLCKRLELAQADCDRIVGVWAAPREETTERLRAAGERTTWITTTRELDLALQSLRGRSNSAA